MSQTNPVRVHSALRNPATWIFVVGAGLVAFVTTFSYLGAFLNPDANVRNLPIALVNEDRGAEFGGKRVVLGQQVMAKVMAPNPALGKLVAWTVLSSRRDALRAIRRDEYFAALVVPPDFSARVLGIAVAQSGSAPRSASIEILANPASGSYAGTFSQSVATKTAQNISDITSKQLTELLGAAGAKVSPSAVRVLGHPVEATVTVAQPIGSHGGRGIAPFYFAVVLSLAGVMGAVIIGSGIDFLTGEVSLELLGRRFQRPHVKRTSFASWSTRVVAGFVFAAVAGSLVTWMAVGILGMEVGSVWQLDLFAMLSIAMGAMATLTLLSAFGIAGELVALFFVVIFGVPSAGGVYPVQALPAFFRFLNGWLPLRFVTDGARALIFFDGRNVGLDRAVAVLSIYTIAATAAGAALTLWIDARRKSRLDRAAAAPAGAVIP